MYCTRLEGRDNVILETQENTIYCLEEEKNKNQKTQKNAVENMAKPSAKRISAHDYFNFGGFFYYSLVQIPSGLVKDKLFSHFNTVY